MSLVSWRPTSAGNRPGATLPENPATLALSGHNGLISSGVIPSTVMRGALGVLWRACHTDTTSPCTARAARRGRAAACRQVTTADPEGLYHARTTQRWQPTLWAHLGGATGFVKLLTILPSP